MFVVSALIMGFIGSFHCVAMCGAIALSLRREGGRRFMVRQVVYNVGRITTYLLLAAAFSTVHTVTYLNDGQNMLSLVSGSLLFLFSLILFLDIGPAQRVSNTGLVFLSRFRSVFIRGQQRDSLGSAYGVGLVNGLLPCGFVYLALAGALAQSSVPDSLLFMFFFGLGTVPSMLGLGALSKLKSFAQFFNSPRFLSGATALAGLLLVLRGMALGIPYLSPQLPSTVPMLNELRHENVCASPQLRPQTRP